MIHRTFLHFVLACLAAAVFANASPVQAASPTLAADGVMRSPSGGPAPDGVYTLTFRLHSGPTGGAALWQEVHVAVAVVSGAFHLALGGQDPLKPLLTKLFSDNDELWLGVQVAADPELPRVKLRHVPYALHALTAEKLTGGIEALECTGCIELSHLAPGVLHAKNVALGIGKQATVHDALLALSQGIHLSGASVGIGKGPANLCGFDVASDEGPTCIDGAPALWTRIAPNAQAMAQFAKEGQLVYRTDDKSAWMRIGPNWRRVQFSQVCGDGFVELPELCDDGAANANAPDKCRVTCVKPLCGDSIVDSSEDCDDGNKVTTDGCAQCKLPSCGDGFVQQGLEACDDGNKDNTDACLAGCKLASCGDGYVQKGVETCDDGNADTGDACAKCKPAVCGDGFVQAGVEECDTAAANSNTPDKCRTSCKKPACGDGILDSGEGCDDGNKTALDGCAPTCQFEVKRVFLTSTKYNGSLGGIVGAAGLCQARADAASLGGAWKAWISGSAASDQVDVRFKQAKGPYRKLDGTTIANNWADLIDGTLASPINMTELKTTLAGENVVTGSNANGTRTTSVLNYSCNNYTTTTTSTLYRRYVGLSSQTASAWSLNTFISNCSTLYSLYCFEQ